MKRILTYVSLLLISGMMLTATGQGRGRQNSSRTNNTSTTSQSRSSRPSAPSNRPGNNNRPDNNRPGNNSRPDNNRPGNNNRPAKPDYRPDNNHRPGGGNAYRPGGYSTPRPPHVHRPTPRPPYRPYAPANRPWTRPVPPPSFRPYHGCPVISTIFGIAIGATLDYSINHLINGGYHVAGYGNNVVYLNNVNMYNYSWPQSQLHYVNGMLSAAELVYSSAAYDMSRYNLLYNSLVGQYGYPISVQNNGGNNVSATWWGYNNGYITLAFYGDYANNGYYRYFTTLSFGN